MNSTKMPPTLEYWHKNYQIYNTINGLRTESNDLVLICMWQVQWGSYSMLYHFMH